MQGREKRSANCWVFQQDWFATQVPGFIGVFSVSGDRVHISGPDRAQIGGDVSLVCSSQESNPPSIIRWTVDGEEKQGTQEEVRSVLCITKYKID